MDRLRKNLLFYFLDFFLLRSFFIFFFFLLFKTFFIYGSQHATNEYPSASRSSFTFIFIVDACGRIGKKGNKCFDLIN